MSNQILIIGAIFAFIAAIIAVIIAIVASTKLKNEMHRVNLYESGTKLNVLYLGYLYDNLEPGRFKRMSLEFEDETKKQKDQLGLDSNIDYDGISDYLCNVAANTHFLIEKY